MNQKGKIALMLFFFAICATAAFITYDAGLKPVPAKPLDLYSVVYNQFTALQTSNFARAYRNASTGMQEKFNVEQFEGMVRLDYSPLLAANRLEFGVAECEGHHAVVQAYLVSMDGAITPCIYSLVNEGEGWKIDGARLLRRIPKGERPGATRV